MKNTTTFNGYSNYETFVMATQIQNTELIYNKVKELYDSGYKSYGSMLCVLRQFARDNKTHDAIKNMKVNFKNETVRAKEITAMFVSLFDKKKPNATKEAVKI